MDATIVKEYPCGYKVNIKLQATSMLDKFDSKILKEEDGCPLHGKDCKAK